MDVGWGEIEHVVIKNNLTVDEAYGLEIELIKEYNSTDRRYGFNSETGGTIGKRLSDSTKKKISNTLKRKGILPPSRKGIGKAVRQYSLDGAYIKTHAMLKDAASEMGVAQQSIASVIRGTTKTSCGYKWKFAEEA